ncbi:MAG: sulfur carrier protein ThiS [bacterium]|nr:sulfur carrier protein ThiS [bacterium]
MNIQLNGETTAVNEGITLAQLLSEQKVENPDMVSVQLNGEFVEKENYATTPLADGAEVDFLYFMGGGA